ncbi:MAG: hypothetical protein K2Y42_06085 [Hyphomicrobium sp.]|jgi:hypothetical protein|uniref:hypothetical protein n=1 Tax=Hyphomicrobium sp. TaxID=82 RepID=UPI0025C52AE4|nr:hypothetical protein [Hyphomicrobium sp.]MBX9862305.1 hypothetical protein [Hyphomicrobium sp.]
MAKSLTSRRHRARIALLAAVPFSVVLAGCSADDVELNGKIFDAVGLNTASVKSAEPKMAERAPLVMPPNPERVPEPGLPPEVAANEVAALKDPDKVAKVSKLELERQQAEYCKVNYEQAKARGDNDADLAAGPLGPCRGSVLSAIKTFTGTENSDDSEE